MDAIGWHGHGGMSIAPISAMEIRAWSEGTGHRLQPWEFDAMHVASAAFVTEYHADNPLPPDLEDPEDNEAKPEKPKVMNAFKSLAAKVNKAP